MKFSHKLKQLSHNVFAEMDTAKAKVKAQGKTIIDLSLGSSDLPTPEAVIQTIKESLDDHSTHAYVLHNATLEFRQEVAQWYSKRYGISINPETEVLPLIGCQEGTAHLPIALLDPGDFALLTDPGYPSHEGGIYLANGQIYTMSLLAENQFLPVYEDIPQEILTQAKLMILNYPHNPTSATATVEFFRKTVNFCRENDIVLIHDFPYADIYFTGTPQPPSVLQADVNKEISVEFFTFSKSYNMGGFRIGFAVGNSQVIKALKQVKSVVDFNQYRGILNGAITALKCPDQVVKNTVKIYEERRDYLVKALQEIGWEVASPSATLYLWAKLPEKWTSTSVDFCIQLVEETGVALTPGSGFGKAGEGYVRFALVRSPEILAIATEKIAQFFQAKRIN
jgi:aspartate/methionine/tyrosine aminotransferase